MHTRPESGAPAGPGKEGKGRLHRLTAGPEAAGARLDRLLAGALPSLSRSRIQRLIRAGHVRVGGATIVDPGNRVKPGQTFAIFVPEAGPSKPEAQDIPLVIAYEDSDLIVVDKPAGLVVHPAPGNPDMTLVNALLAHCGDTLSGIGGERRPGIVHRLDKDTGGLMVAAKNDVAHAGLIRQFAARTVERAYTAVAWGVPRPARGDIEAPIGRNPRNRKKMAVVRRGGRPAVTRYQVLRSFGDGVASLVECRLATGRTHQIRVHMAHIGHPLVGDTTYGGAGAGWLRRLSAEPRARLAAALAALGRQALHAHLLGFEHPVRGDRLRFESDLPRDFEELLVCLENL